MKDSEAAFIYSMVKAEIINQSLRKWQRKILS